jgi:hypothetical protein
LTKSTRKKIRWGLARIRPQFPVERKAGPSSIFRGTPIQPQPDVVRTSYYQLEYDETHLELRIQLDYSFEMQRDLLGFCLFCSLLALCFAFAVGSASSLDSLYTFDQNSPDGLAWSAFIWTLQLSLLCCWLTLALSLSLKTIF